MRALRSFSAAAIAAFFVTVGACSSSSDSAPATTTDSGHVGDSTTTDSGATDSSVTETSTHETSPFDSRIDTTPPGDGGACASRHPGDECDMVAQTGCSGTDTCDYDPASGHSKCMANPIGTGAKGDPCDTTKLCDKGLFCYEGHCSPACCPGDNSVCGSAGSVSGTCNLDITQPSDAGSDTIIYNVCTYSTPCHAFEYDCPDNQDCLFDTAPDSFSCQPPSKPAAYAAVPGTTCVYSNDCGESQGCFTTDGGKTFKCFLFCWLTTPDGFSPGADAKGRFAANGTCTVGGKSYGACSDASSAGIGGGLGLCL